MAVKTFEELYTDALRQVDSSSGSGSSTAKIIIKAGINEAYSEIAGLKDWETLKNSTTFASVAGTNEYTPVASGTSTPRLRRIESVLDETNEKYLSEEKRDVFERAYPYVDTTNDQGTPTIWYPSGYDSNRDVNIKLYKVPDAANTYRIHYFEEPVAMTADADEPRIPDQYHYGLTYAAVAKFYEFDKDPVANYYRSMFKDFRDSILDAEWGNTDEMPQMEPRTRNNAGTITGKLGRIYN